MIATSVLFLACFVNFATFFWSVIGVFKKHAEQDRGSYALLGLTSFATWTTCLIEVVRLQPGFEFAAFGIAAQALSFALFHRARSATRKQKLTIIFSKDSPQFIVREGPYKWVRHPFYTSYIVSYFGAAIALQSVAAFVCAGVMTCLYLVASRSEERKFAGSDFATEYAKYKASTGAFLPRPAHVVERLKKSS